jgi:hypothetical protein
MSDTYTMTVSEQVAQVLANFVTPIKNGTRKISTYCISPPHKRQYPPPSMTISPSPNPAMSAEYFLGELFSSFHFFDEYQEVEIPAVIESIETLEFIGFTYATARILWESLVKNRSGSSQFDLDFLGIVTYYLDNVEGVPDCTSQDDDWHGAMTKIGINDELQRAIMHPVGTRYRFTASMKFWVRDAVESRFESLLSLDQRLRDQSYRLVVPSEAAKLRVSAIPSSEATTGTREMRKSISTAPFSSSQSQKSRSNTAESSKDPDSEFALSIQNSIYLHGHTTIWKATTMEKAKALYDENTGEIKLSAGSSVPSDFSGEIQLCYWTPDRLVADEYARWVKLKTPIANIAIVRMFVPESLINSLQQEKLWFHPRAESDDWRKIVFASRNGEEWPKEFRKRWNNCDLIMGHLLSGNNIKYNQMRTSYIDIKESDLLHIGSEDNRYFSVQWVFKGSEGKEAFETQCRGKGHIYDVGVYRAQFRSR